MGLVPGRSTGFHGACNILANTLHVKFLLPVWLLHCNSSFSVSSPAGIDARGVVRGTEQNGAG